MPALQGFGEGDVKVTRRASRLYRPRGRLAAMSAKREQFSANDLRVLTHALRAGRPPVPCPVDAVYFSVENHVR